MAGVSVSGGSQPVVVNYDSQSYAALASSLIGSLPSTTISTSGPFVIPADGSSVTVFGSTAGAGLGDVTGTDNNSLMNQVILAGNGTNLNLTAPTGGGSIIAGNGQNVFNLNGTTAQGSWDVFLGPGGNVVNGDGGAGNGFVVMGGADSVTAGTGNEVVFGAALAGGQVSTASPTIPASAGAVLTYAGGAGAGTVTGGTGLLFGYGGSGNTTYDITQAPSGGTQTAAVTAGTQVAAVLVGGTGTTTVNSTTGLVQYYGTDGSSLSFSGNTDNNLFVAGSGNETLNGAGATGSNVMYAGTGSDQLLGGAGNDILVAGDGSSTLAGGTGSNIFAFIDQAGGSTSMDTINDFTSSDTLELIGGVTVASQDLSTGDLVVTLSDETKITFVGLNYDLPTGSITHF